MVLSESIVVLVVACAAAHDVHVLATADDCATRRARPRLRPRRDRPQRADPAVPRGRHPTRVAGAATWSGVRGSAWPWSCASGRSSSRRGCCSTSPGSTSSRPCRGGRERAVGGELRLHLVRLDDRLLRQLLPRPLAHPSRRVRASTSYRDTRRSSTSKDHITRLPLVVAGAGRPAVGRVQAGPDHGFDWWIEGRGRAPSWIGLFAFYAAVAVRRSMGCVVDAAPEVPIIPLPRHRRDRDVRRGHHLRCHPLPRSGRGRRSSWRPPSGSRRRPRWRTPGTRPERGHRPSPGYPRNG